MILFISFVHHFTKMTSIDLKNHASLVLVAILILSGDFGACHARKSQSWRQSRIHLSSIMDKGHSSRHKRITPPAPAPALKPKPPAPTPMPIHSTTGILCMQRQLALHRDISRDHTAKATPNKPPFVWPFLLGDIWRVENLHDASD